MALNSCALMLFNTTSCPPGALPVATYVCQQKKAKRSSSRSNNNRPTAHLFKAELLELVEQFLLLGNVYALRALQFGLRDVRQPLGVTHI